ncbi:MAG: Flp pilus assembly complex ATPase component TadA [Actinobacteria bacterium]|nr:Flp pilus assembly complex ATPase component TadA [Actinomycetota bacterium]
MGEMKTMDEEWELRFGDALVEGGVITAAELERALAASERTGKRLRSILMGERGLSEHDIMRNLSQSTGLPLIHLEPGMMDERAKAAFPVSMTRKYNVLPLRFEGDELVVAADLPLDIAVLESLAFTSGHPIQQVLAGREEIAAIIGAASGGDRLEEWMGEWEDELLEYVDRNREVEQAGVEEFEVKEGDVVKLVNLLITRAIKMDASDIHIEPEEGFSRIRMRVDGQLREIVKVPDELHKGMVSRLKVLSELDIAERRLPHDGSFFVHFQGRDIDLRTSTSPTIYGESVSLRLLDQGKAAVRLEDLGMEPEDLARTAEALEAPHGFVLSTGPTGCGKTTTMYAMINGISTPEMKIVTIEDPVEYRLDLVNQIPVNHAIGLGFARILRSVLRQDPNVILVGEIRDMETASVAVQAALTGHLLLSTLHTNNAPETLLRLVEMGIEAYYVREVVRLVIAQRLVRLLCPECKEKYSADAREREELGEPADGDTVLFRARGCDACAFTGYRGRSGVFEVMPMSEELKEMMTTDVPMRVIKEKAVEQGMRTMWRNAVSKVREGRTSLEEIRRLIPREG